MTQTIETFFWITDQFLQRCEYSIQMWLFIWDFNYDLFFLLKLNNSNVLVMFVNLPKIFVCTLLVICISNVKRTVVKENLLPLGQVMIFFPGYQVGFEGHGQRKSIAG